ncbi:hypothetical protein ABLE94_02985 [Gordonia sp. VNK1]|uniref:hypothetical protein n=1 Tax=Gordonia oleivorans TaxID=3156618 RepID=UPI0032B3CBB6
MEFTVGVEYYSRNPDLDHVEALLDDATGRAPDVPLPDITLILTNDLAASVRDRTGSTTYSSMHRGDSVTAAKTLNLDDGCCILLNGRLVDIEAQTVTYGAATGDAARIVAHELMHAAVTFRGEDRLLSSPSGIVWSAARMVSEHRVERALCDTGWVQDFDYVDAAVSLLQEIAAPPLQRLTMGLPSAVSPTSWPRFTEALAYAAAMPRGIDSDPEWRSLSHRVEGTTLLAVLRELPDASQTLAEEVERAAVMRLVEALERATGAASA